jgi:hypothetical protein
VIGWLGGRHRQQASSHREFGWLGSGVGWAGVFASKLAPTGSRSGSGTRLTGLASSRASPLPQVRGQARELVLTGLASSLAD